MKSKSSVRCALICASLLLLGVAGTASAAPKSFSMAGEAQVFVGIGLPLLGTGLDAQGAETTFPYNKNGQAANGCINCVTQQTGISQPTLTLPQGIFSAPGPTPAPFRGFPVTGNATLFQLTTQFKITLPGTTGGVVLSGRNQGPDTFSWCPGTGAGQGLACTTPTAGSSPAGQGFVTYTKDPAGGRFGGIMRTFLTSTNTSGVGGTLAQLQANSPLQANFQDIGDSGFLGAGGSTAQLPGTFTNVLTGSRPVHTILGQTPGGFITSKVPTPAFSIPNTGTRRDFFFPFTTGMVTISAVVLTPVNGKFTLTGSDTRGSDGTGMLTMVAGGIIQAGGGNWSLHHTTASVTLAPEPATWLAAGGALLALGIGRTLTRRSN